MNRQSYLAREQTLGSLPTWDLLSLSLQCCISSRTFRAGMQSHCNQRCAPDDQVDPNKQPHCPGRSPWQIENYDAHQTYVEDTACQHPRPTARELTTVLEREHN